jgi:methylthioribulose-1-phosphate dehydratase
VQKELMKPTDMFVMDFPTKAYLRKPTVLLVPSRSILLMLTDVDQVHKPSACTPLFLAAFTRGAGCCIHTHSQWAVLITLLVERDFGKEACFEIQHLEQIKGIGKGRGKAGNLGYFDKLSIPIIENTAR